MSYDPESVPKERIIHTEDEGRLSFGERNDLETSSPFSTSFLRQSGINTSSSLTGSPLRQNSKG
jgi:hypothetical protein